jgi:hypothetical protein
MVESTLHMRCLPNYWAMSRGWAGGGGGGDVYGMIKGMFILEFLGVPTGRRHMAS